VHANTPRDGLARIENMVLMANLDLPLKSIREQIASAITIMVQLSRMRDGSRRVTHVSEIVGMEGETITMQDIFLYKQYGVDANGKVRGDMVATGMRPRCVEKFEAEGIELPPDLFAKRSEAGQWKR
jgi:pilus assembly protein CpaF